MDFVKPESARAKPRMGRAMSGAVFAYSDGRRYLQSANHGEGRVFAYGQIVADGKGSKVFYHTRARLVARNAGLNYAPR